MASTLKLNALKNATIVRNEDGSVNIVRTGYINGLDTNGASNDEIFAESVSTPGLPAMLSAYPGTRYSSALLRRMIIDANPVNNKKAFVRMEYSSKITDPAAPPITFVLQRRTTLVEETTELHPNGLVPMVVWWRNPDNLLDFIQRTSRNKYLRPFQRLVASGYWRAGSPPASMIDALGSVNDAQWRGKPPGYWLYADQSDITQDSGGSYNITLELWSKINRDWSTWDILRDHVGRNLKINQSDVDDLKNEGYTYGMSSRNGILKSGLYPTADFEGIFGFGSIL